LAREIKRPGVNLMVMWEEYRDAHPDGYSYSRYVAAALMWSSAPSPCWLGGLGEIDAT
jgi:transposase